MGKRNKVPFGWEKYSPIGRVIDGTQFIPFKTPLNDVICNNLKNMDQRFTVYDLIEKVPTLSLVIDLTNTKGYFRYDVKALEEANIQYHRVNCKGHGMIPNKKKLDQFFEIIDNELSKKENKLIGVHCTHGLNRTGFMICKYMIQRLGIPAYQAISQFEDARGHKIERNTYIKDLHMMATCKTDDNQVADSQNTSFQSSLIPNQRREQASSGFDPWNFNSIHKSSYGTSANSLHKIDDRRKHPYQYKYTSPSHSRYATRSGHVSSHTETNPDHNEDASKYFCSNDSIPQDLYLKF